jgi:diguanylate cyclase (GGDEF)-like protein
LADWMRKLGFYKTSLIIMLFAMAVSIGLTILMSYLFFGYLDLKGILMAVIIPGILAPTFSFSLIRAAFQLDEAREKLEIMSVTDALTGAFNRRYFFEQLDMAFSHAQRNAEPFSILFFDIDDFKLINDHFSHIMGDEVLKAITKNCREKSRISDVFARLGGDEFAFLLRETDQAAAIDFADRITKTLSSLIVTHGGRQTPVSVSIGAVTWNPETPNTETLLVKADKAMYEAKRQRKTLDS